MTTQQSQLAFPFEPANPFEPAAEYAVLREDDPVARVLLPSGDRVWLVTRYEDNKRLLSDPRFSRAATTDPDAPRLQPIPPIPTALMVMDPPEHTRLRKFVSRTFTSRRVELLRPKVQRHTDALLDRMAAAGPPADLITGLGRTLPMNVICELLGVPPRGQERFWAWADAVFSLTAFNPAQMLAARDGLLTELATLVEEKRAEPGEDLLSALVQAHDDGDSLSADELVALACTLLVAGFHTTSGQITLSVLCLLRHPRQLALLRERPQLIVPAVEELLRYNALTISGGLIRIATEDVELGGVTISKGDGVLPALSSANRDGAVFALPDEFDVTRGDNPQIAFGHGIHYCLGAHLARVELQVAIGSLLRRFPNLRLAVAQDELEWNTGRIGRTLTGVPVAW